MSPSAPRPNVFRVLIIDDTEAIHQDIRKVLAPSALDELESLEEELLSHPAPVRASTSRFEIDSAYQGDEGVGLVNRALEDGRPYALVFLDMRMPPGMDGLETMRQLWQLDTGLQIVICTAFSDYSWDQIAATTGPTARVVILRKPFEPIEVNQLAHALTEKWRLEKEARRHAGELERRVSERTKELAESQIVFHVLLEEKIQEAKRDLASKEGVEN